MLKLLFILSVLTTHPITRDANVGVLVCDYYTGDTIDAYRENCVIPPASTMKLLTTATLMDMWGGDYRFRTPITYTGDIREGVLYGDIYIEGRGDPTFGSQYVGSRAFLYRWLREIRNAGIRRIAGSVVADVSYFDGNALNPAWLWEDAGNYYAPGVYALSYMDNTMNIILRSGPVGSVAEVLYTTPVVPEVEFENHIRCAATSYDGAFVHGVPYSNKRYLVGSVPANRQTFGVMGDLPNPSLLLARDLTAVLRSGGVAVDGEARYMSEAPQDGPLRSELFVYESDSLFSIVEHTNHASDNLYAEMLFRTLGSRYGVPCTIHNASDFMREYWRNRGVSLRTARVLDGCGLAPQDAVSPAQFVQILRYMYGSHMRDSFVRSLPRSGESGTLQSFLSGTTLHGCVSAKSGTIGGTKNYAGYMFLPDGRVWVFAVMVNSANARPRKIQHVIEQYLLDVYQANK